MVPEGSSAKLICKARGFPKPKVTWRREDGREIIARNGSHGKTKGLVTQMNFLSEKFSLKIKFFFLFYTALVVEGETLWLSKVTRSEMGAYLCIASNAVPPSVSKRIKLQVHCKYAYNFSLVDIVYFQFSVYWKKKSYSNISTTGNLYVLSISVAWFMLIYFSLSITQRHHDLPPVKFIEGNLYISYLCTLCIRIRKKKGIPISLWVVWCTLCIRIIENIP